MSWILQCSYNGKKQAEVSTWRTEKDAMKAACEEMLREIRLHWDMKKDHVFARAMRINLQIRAGNYIAAMNLWNDSKNKRQPRYYVYYQNPLKFNMRYKRMKTLEDSFFLGN